MIDPKELARHHRLARRHAWRMKNDSAYWDEQVKLSMARKQAADLIEARTAADLARGVEVGSMVEIGDHPMVTPAGFETNLKGLRGTVRHLTELPMGGLLATVEVVAELDTRKPLTADDLRWAKRTGRPVLGRLSRVQPISRYQLAVSKLQLA